jgi:protein gp37
MSFTWFHEKPKEVIVTLASGNITLNKQASMFFEHAFAVMLGVNHHTHQIAIKPLTKEAAMSHVIPENQKYKITLKSSYARITNKAFIWQKIISTAGDYLGKTQRDINWE